MMSGNVIGKVLGGLLLPNLGDILERKCKIECSAAATRIILACKAYQMGMHELPDCLESLVPEYINSITELPAGQEASDAGDKQWMAQDIVFNIGQISE